MTIISKDHFETWANTTSSKSELPHLISRLVRATTGQDSKVNIPWGSATYIGGWDGIVACEQETNYIPKGESLWEFGTNKDCKAKANDDYQKRKENPLGFDPSSSTFIFVTPRVWSKKDEWAAEKKAENYWKDVRAYDAIDLTQWLDIAPAVSRWFASQEGVNAYPFDGVITGDQFWEEWSTIPSGLKLLPTCITSGRGAEVTKIHSALKGKPAITSVKAATRSEALAFVVASALTLEEDDLEYFLSRTLIIDTEASFRGITQNAHLPLNIICRFDSSLPLNKAIESGHRIFIPLSPEDSEQKDVITLPIISRQGQIDSLQESGLSYEQATAYSKEAGRDITILRKLLGCPNDRTKLYQDDDLRELIPALLLGRWNETYAGDIELLEKLSGQKYDDCLVVLHKWRHREGSPLIKIGKTWRLTSPFDLWTTLSSRLLQRDFENLREYFLEVFQDDNPTLEAESLENPWDTYTQRRKYSGSIREGLAQTLILTAISKEKSLSDLKDPQEWVTQIVEKLLYNASGELWCSITHELPLIAEASPKGFLSALRRSLSSEPPKVMQMFSEEAGFWGKTSHHAGLLWALEGLAWLPQHLAQASLILLQLAKRDPGGQLANRPINSLVEIFKAWHPQTIASYNERIKVLKHLASVDKDTAWKLLVKLLPNPFESAMGTHRLRWRMFEEISELEVTDQEVWDTHTAVLELLLELFDGDEGKFTDLMEALPKLSTTDRNRLLNWSYDALKTLKQEDYTAWHSLRGLLHHHRSFPDADWALPEEDLAHIEQLYQQLEPTETHKRLLWLFDEDYPELPIVMTVESSDILAGTRERCRQIEEVRLDAVKTLLDELGLLSTLELRKQVKLPNILGRSLAQALSSQEETLTICMCLKDEAPYNGLATGFIEQKFRTEGLSWLRALVEELLNKKHSDKAIANVLIGCGHGRELWGYIDSLNNEIQDLYWSGVSPCFYHLPDEEATLGLGKLLVYKRFFSALNLAGLYPKTYPTEMLIAVLRGTAFEPANEAGRIKSHNVSRIFSELYNRPDIRKETLCDLEWLYINLLTSDSSHRHAKCLEEKLATNPEFFIDVLKLQFRPLDETLREKEQEGLSDEQIANGAMRAYSLLRSWQKIPGMREDHSIDLPYLRSWVSQARELAQSVSRLAIAEETIGQVLARHPETSPKWPNEDIFKLIEEVSSEDLNRGYSVGIFNKLGVTIRGAFDGGDIERAEAKRFSELAKSIELSYPTVAEIFDKLSKGYNHDAHRRDEEAMRESLDC